MWEAKSKRSYGYLWFCAPASPRCDVSFPLLSSALLTIRIHSIQMCDASELKPSIQETRDSICDIWGARTPYYGQEQWPVRVDERREEEPDDWVQSACAMCSNGCGLDIGVKNGRIVGVRGRAVDRVNHGRLGPKGLHGSYAANHHPDRLKTPLIRKNGQLVPASWDEAMDLIVHKTKETIKELSVHAIGIYTTGQLFLEEYYTLSVIGKGGLHTNHMDGNTRLCTATAAASMRETFGADGQPGSYTDIDTTECIMLVGHNISNTQTVLWSRILDRLQGAKPPKIIVIDPRTTATAKKATIHAAPKIGTNLALLNGIQHLLFKKSYVKLEWVKEHLVGVEQLREVVESYLPEKVQEITGVSVTTLHAIADILGTSNSLLSTCLQGVYQSNQATASACAINNINLLLGMIGRPGCGIYQMNGQPTAQNSRETGCDGEYPAFRNHENKEHMQDLAKHWNVDVNTIPHWHVPTHIMQMLHFIETGSIKMFWVSGTNPAVSLPDLENVRKLFTKPDLFLIVQDLFLTETAQLASVVLPAAMWGEKTGTFTNVDRTVHISYKAVEPPGQAKSDLDIWLDYAKRMDFRDKDGQPLVKWQTPEETFEAWKAVSKGTLCDYSGLSYEKLTGGSGIQWPCDEKSPNGTERLYSNWVFPTDLARCQSWGHDLETGTPITKAEYVKLNPNGRAILKSCHYRQSEEMPSVKYPFMLSTGRLVYHFHTRTKTARSQALNNAAPGPYAQISAKDAEELKIKEDDLVQVTSSRGSVQLPAKVGDIEPGIIFIPFHYGYWDQKEGSSSRAANELTRVAWDFVSKQPLFKSGAVQLKKIEGNQVKVHEKQSEARKRREAEEQNNQRTIESTLGLSKSHAFIQDCLGLLMSSLHTLQLTVYPRLIEQNSSQAELRIGLEYLLELCKQVESRLRPFAEKYKEKITKEDKSESGELAKALFPGKRAHGSLAYNSLRDMQGLATFLTQIESILTALISTAAAAQDGELADAVQFAKDQVARQYSWAMAQCKVLGPQTLLVPAMPVK
jgi:ferredoxin-nitrate reductase